MSREIKFRGKSASNSGCWIYGYFAIIDGQNYIINSEGIFLVLAGLEGQYTGLKDVNEKEIYEGDIVEIKGYDLCDYVISKVVVSEGRFGIYNYRHSDWCLGNIYKYAEVIGDIYSNPELLKESL